MVGGSLRVLRLLPPLKLVAMIYNVAEILLKVVLKHQKSINKSINKAYYYTNKIEEQYQ
jgi:hypothetical protein